MSEGITAESARGWHCTNHPRPHEKQKKKAEKKGEAESPSGDKDQGEKIYPEGRVTRGKAAPFPRKVRKEEGAWENENLRGGFRNLKEKGGGQVNKSWGEITFDRWLTGPTWGRESAGSATETGVLGCRDEGKNTAPSKENRKENPTLSLVKKGRTRSRKMGWRSKPGEDLGSNYSKIYIYSDDKSGY